MISKMIERANMYPPEFGNIDMVKIHAVWRPCPKEEARVIRWEPPARGKRYLVSIDPMTGETQTGGKDPDNHAVGVIRAGYFEPDKGWRPPRLVARLVNDFGAWERQRIYELRWDIDVLEEQVWRLAQYYGNCLIVPEVNMDRGLIELLKLRGSAQIYIRKFFNKREQKETNAYGWKTDPSTREVAVENLARAIRELGKDGEGVEIQCPITLSELQTFVVKSNGRSEAMPGKHDDCVLQMALGLITIDGATTFSQPIAQIHLPPDLAALEKEDQVNSRVDMATKW